MSALVKYLFKSTNTVRLKNLLVTQVDRLVSKSVLERHNVFTTGKGGTVKKFLINQLIESLPTHNIFAVTCTTGTACNNLLDSLQSLGLFLP